MSLGVGIALRYEGFAVVVQLYRASFEGNLHEVVPHSLECFGLPLDHVHRTHS
jgi:hypothetical protein